MSIKLTPELIDETLKEIDKRRLQSPLGRMVDTKTFGWMEVYDAICNSGLDGRRMVEEIEKAYSTYTGRFPPKKPRVGYLTFAMVYFQNKFKKD